MSKKSEAGGNCPLHVAVAYVIRQGLQKEGELPCPDEIDFFDYGKNRVSSKKCHLLIDDSTSPRCAVSPPKKGIPFHVKRKVSALVR